MLKKTITAMIKNIIQRYFLRDLLCFLENFSI